jgi:MFS family permease
VRLRFGGLWRHPDFVRLWAGQTVSVFGSLVSRTALPFTAIIYLHARPFQVALVTSADLVAGIFVGLAAGVSADRFRRRPMMIVADIGRALALGSIPLAAVFGVLRVEQLYVVAFATGVLTTFFDVAYQSYLPTIVSADELIEGNSKLTASFSVAEFGAFSASGWLVQLLTAPGAIVIDALSFVFSAASLRTIRTPETPVAPPGGRLRLRVEVTEGLRFIGGDGVLRAVTASFVALSFASGMTGAVFILYTNRELGFAPGVLGLIFGVGGLTSLVGATLAGAVARRAGVGGAMVLGLGLAGVGMLAVAGARDASVAAAALLVAQQLITDPSWTVYEINQVSLRQAMTPAHLLGRVNAAVRMAALVAALAGSLVAGLLAERYGARPVIVASACIMLVGAAVLLASPARAVKSLPVDAGAVRP